MNPETKQLRSMVAFWETKKRHAEKMVKRLRSALELAEKHDGVATTETPRRRSTRPKKNAPLAPVPPPAPFTRKYEKAAKEYVFEVLAEKGESSLATVRTLLASMGFRYTVQSLSESVRGLERAGRVKRRRAPAGTGSHYVYAIVRQNSTGVQS